MVRRCDVASASIHLIDLLRLFIVIGALLGTQEGRKVEIVNTFELAMEEDGTTVDAGFLVTRRDQCAS